MDSIAEDIAWAVSVVSEFCIVAASFSVGVVYIVVVDAAWILDKLIVS